MGVGVGYLDKPEDLAAVLLAGVIDRYRSWGTATWSEPGTTISKGIDGYRNFVLRDADRRFVRAASVWFLYDLEKGQPIRVTTEDDGPYGGARPRLDLGIGAPENSGAGPVWDSRAGDGQPPPSGHYSPHEQCAVRGDGEEAVPAGITIRESG